MEAIHIIPRPRMIVDIARESNQCDEVDYLSHDTVINFTSIAMIFFLFARRVWKDADPVISMCVIFMFVPIMSEQYFEHFV